MTITSNTSLHDVSYGEQSNTGSGTVTIIFEGGVATSITGSASSWTQCVGGRTNANYAGGTAKVTAAEWV